jgi:hypothetical protein
MLQPQESVTVTHTQVLMHVVKLITAIQRHTLMIFLESSSWGPQLVKELPAFYGTARFTTFIGAHSPPAPYHAPAQSSPCAPQLTSRRSILILSSHICLSFVFRIMKYFKIVTFSCIYIRNFRICFWQTHTLVHKVITIWDDNILTWCNHKMTFPHFHW